MPVSSISNRTMTSLSVSLAVLTRTTTSPRSVNFTALPTKLFKICRTRPESPRKVAQTLGAIWQASSMPLRLAISDRSSRELSTVSTRLKSRISKLSLPSSILGEIQYIVDDRKQRLTAGTNGFSHFALLFIQFAIEQ